MKHLINTLGLAAVLAIPGLGHAGTVLYSFNPDFYPEALKLDCLAVNLNPTPQTAMVEVFDPAGNLIFSTGSVLVQPGASSGLTTSNSDGNGALCKYTLAGSAKKWRASAILSTK